MPENFKIALRNKGFEAIVDAEDYERVARFEWSIARCGHQLYAVMKRDGSRIAVYMHRFILRLKSGDGLMIDHINRNGLDNRRVNLRLTSHRGNRLNARDNYEKQNRNSG